MKVIFYNEAGKRVPLFENTMASQYLYCVSRAMVEPDKISAHKFVEEMMQDNLPHTRNFLQFNIFLRQRILALEGQDLINCICGLRFAGLSRVRLIDVSTGLDILLDHQGQTQAKLFSINAVKRAVNYPDNNPNAGKKHKFVNPFF